jgi:hypothetical protein
MLRSHSLVALALGLALLPVPAAAQAVHYHPAEGAIMSHRVSDAPTWQAAWQQSRLCGLCQLPELAAAIELATGRAEARVAVLTELYEMLAAIGGPADDDEILAELRPLEDVRWQDLRCWVYAAKDDGSVVIALRAIGEDAAKVSGVLDKIVARLVDGGTFVSSDGPELGGQKSKQLLRKVGGEQPAQANDPDSPQLWYWHKDGLYVVGIGENPPLGTLGAEPAPRHAMDVALLGDNAGGFMTFDVARAIELAAEDSDPAQRRRTQVRMAAVGVDVVRSLSFAMGFDGKDVRESLFVETAGEPGGLLGAWLGATAALPAHPQVDDALLQVGFALDLSRLGAAMKAMREAAADEGDEPAEPDEFEQMIPELQKALSGGISLQVSGPAVGSMVPRMSLALGVADRQALEALIGRARTKFPELGFEQRDTDGVSWTCVKIPNSPSAFVPSFAFLGDAFVLAESPATLRAMIRGRDGAPAMPVEGAPCATPLGDPLPALEVRYDGAAIWRVMQERYLPAVKLLLAQARLSGGPDFTPLLDAREMPDLEPFGAGLGLGRGGLSRAEGGYVWSAAGSFGDPLSTAMMTTVVPLSPTLIGMALDAATGEVQGNIGAARLKKVHEALGTFRTSFGNGSTLPKELGELFARGLLDDENALLVPGDADPTAVEYEDLDGEIQEVKSSFRYSPEGKLLVSRADLRRYASGGAGATFAFRLFEDDDKPSAQVALLLFEQRAHKRGNRLVLDAEGKVHSLGEDGAKKLLGQ